MASYVFLYSGGKMPEGEAAVAQVMEAWGSWFGSLGDAVQDGGNPFMPATKTIAPDGSVKDGGISASGYSIIKADSFDDAVSKAKRCPVLQGGSTITVYEIHPAM